MTESPEELLRTDFNGQDRRFGEAFAVIKRGISDRAFPGASVAIVHSGVLVALQGFGRFTYESSSPRANSDTIYDLASLTKVVSTTAMAMILYDRGVLHLDAPVIELLPQFATDDERRSEVTARMLLTHTSGLPAYERLFLRFVTRDKLLAAAMKLSLVNEPGTVTEYSDVGFILLGRRWLASQMQVWIHSSNVNYFNRFKCSRPPSGRKRACCRELHRQKSIATFAMES